MSIIKRIKLNAIFLFSVLLSLYFIGLIINQFVYHIIFGSWLGYNIFLNRPSISLNKHKKILALISTVIALIFILIGYTQNELLNGVLVSVIFVLGFSLLILLHQKIAMG